MVEMGKRARVEKVSKGGKGGEEERSSRIDPLWEAEEHSQQLRGSVPGLLGEKAHTLLLA